MFAVKHKEYGEGYAVCFGEKDGKSAIVIDFGEVKKTFLFPDDFAETLTAKDESIQRQIMEELNQKRQGKDVQ